MIFSVCLDALYPGADTAGFAAGMKQARDAGFPAIEFWTWWNKDLAAIARAKAELGLEIAAFCTRFVNLCDAGRHPEYLDGLRETIAAAQRLGCPTIISQAGNELAGVSREEHHANIVQGLRLSAPLLEAAGLTLVLEPLNTLVNHKGYYLWSSREGFEIIDEVGSPHVRLLFDIYHQQIMEGNLISNITANIGKIGHFHTAGNPGRHEITTGEINYREVFQAIRDAGYIGSCGLEYSPAIDVATGLKEAMDLISQPAVRRRTAIIEPVYPQTAG